MKEFCDNLKSLRKAKNRTQKEMAEHLGVAYRTYQSYEYGDRETNFEILLKLADYFDVSTDYLLGRTNRKGNGNLS